MSHAAKFLCVRLRNGGVAYVYVRYATKDDPEGKRYYVDDSRIYLGQLEQMDIVPISECRVYRGSGVDYDTVVGHFHIPHDDNKSGTFKGATLHPVEKDDYIFIEEGDTLTITKKETK